MKLIGNKALFSAATALLALAAISATAPSGATGAVASLAAGQVLPHSGHSPSGRMLLARVPRATRIADCLRDVNATAEAMARECIRRYPVNKKGLSPGYDECVEGVVDYLTIQGNACRRMK